jgi:predicted GNAT family N-acyltransferase
MSARPRPQSGGRGSGRGCYRVTVAVLAGDADAPDWANSLDSLLSDREVPGHDETFRFDVERWNHLAILDDWLERRQRREVAPRLVVVSDQFIETTPLEVPGPTALVEAVRHPFSSGNGLCALVAVFDRPLGRVRDVDATVNTGNGPDGLVAGILRAATSLRLKSPPRRRQRTAEGLRIETARDQQTLRACFALRHRIYGMLGYLPDDVAAESCGLEIDGYDVHSIHLAAVVGEEVVGTVRLILGGVEVSDSKQPAWTRALARRCGPSIRQRVESPAPWGLPVMASPAFRRVWSRLSTGPKPPVELSRLIVAPEWRGLGVSSLLIGGVVAEAKRLGPRPVVLECIPAQRRLYYAHGFRLMNHRLSGGPRLRPVDLDVPAIGLWLPLDLGSSLDIGAHHAPEAAATVEAAPEKTISPPTAL